MFPNLFNGDRRVELATAKTQASMCLTLNEYRLEGGEKEEEEEEEEEKEEREAGGGGKTKKI